MSETGKFKVGDTVVITKKVTYIEGRCCEWVSDMNATIGLKGKVEKIEYQLIGVRFDSGHLWYYDSSALTLEPEVNPTPSPTMPPFKIGDMVKVGRKAEAQEGWKCNWVLDMTRMFERKLEGKVEEVEWPGRGIRVKSNKMGHGYWFPPSALTSVSESTPSFKPGDIVKVVKRVENQAGWILGWAPGMDKTVGVDTYTVGNVSWPGRGVELLGTGRYRGDFLDLYFPPDALVLVTPVTTTVNQQENIEMNPTTTTRAAFAAVETKTFIFGKESRQVTDEEIYGHIARLEAKIAELNKIENKPKKLQAEIKRLQDEIKDLVKFCDDRE